MTFVRDLMIIGGLLVFASGLFDDSFLFFFRFAPSESPISMVFFFFALQRSEICNCLLSAVHEPLCSFPFFGDGCSYDNTK